MATIRTGSDINRVVARVNSAAAVAFYTGIIGEVILDSTHMALVLQDGVTQGGFRLQATSAAPLSAASTTPQIITKVNEILTNLTAAKLMG